MTTNDYFNYQNGELFAERVPLAAIAAQFGTPCYVYSRAALTENWRQFSDALRNRDYMVCYAVKANSNLAILNVFARLGAGFDIVSGGELQRVLAAGGDARKVVFSGVGKTAAEMRLALDADVLCFNVESPAELERLNEVAKAMGKIAPVSLRVNPDVDAKTHPYISTGLKQNKFGVAYGEAVALYRRASGLANLRITGMDCHIGSQLTEVSPFIAALEKILVLTDTLAGAGIHLEHLDLGGGLGIRYRDETPPTIADYAGALLTALGNRREKLILEPGRVLVGNAGVLLTRVEYLKHGGGKNFAIVDAAMNDLMRPALYDAYHEILPVIREPSSQSSDGTTGETTDVTTSHLTNPAEDAGQVIGYSHSTKQPEGGCQVVGYPASGESEARGAEPGEREVGQAGILSQDKNSQRQSLIYEVVGPICETGDFIGHERDLAISPQSLLAVLSAGAYGMSMSSNYNTRPRAAEVMVDGDTVHLVRERETLPQLYAGEKLIP